MIASILVKGDRCVKNAGQLHLVPVGNNRMAMNEVHLVYIDYRAYIKRRVWLMQMGLQETWFLAKEVFN